MGKTYRRSSVDKFERRQRKANRGPKKQNMNNREDFTDNFEVYEKIDINKYK
jgi:hypothetical protein